MASRFVSYLVSDGVHVLELVLPDSMDSLEFDSLNEHVDIMLAKADGAWVVDLAGTNYVGSAVLGLLINIRQRLKSRGVTLVLCGLSERLQEIFDAGSLGRLFVVERSRTEAIASLKE